MITGYFLEFKSGNPEKKGQGFVPLNRDGLSLSGTAPYRTLLLDAMGTFFL
jgi:hypothetical protein